MLALFAAMLSLQRCGNQENITRTPIVDYNAQDLKITSSFQVYHLSKDSSLFFIKLNTENLLYIRDDSPDFAAKVRVKVSPYILGDGSTLRLKSKTFQFSDVDNSKRAKDILASAVIHLQDGLQYNLKVQIIDMNKKREVVKFFAVSKDHPNSRHFFSAYESDLKIPLFTDRIAPHSTYVIKNNSNPTGVVHVKYFKRDFPLPPPPFSYYEPRSFDYTPDSTFTLMLDPWNKTMFTSGDAGFYHFQVDPGQKEGFTLFVSHDDHPELTEMSGLYETFRYLVSSKEYNRIAADQQPKRRFESYWLQWCGNKERARSSIAAYYSRVEEANQFFSAHVDGWRTDRGLVYIIYGKPNKVYRSATQETWIYGEENNPMSITFNFVKVINPFTDNHFNLMREDYYKPSWYRSLEAWRNGRVY